MPHIKLIKNPGFLYDLNFLFYAKFNTQLCIDTLVDESKKESYKKHLNDILQYFGEISEDLYVFYHAKNSGRCFMTTYYMDPYKDHFVNDFDFKFFICALSDTEQLKKNLIRFYLHNLSDDALEECFASTEKLFSHIKASKYTGEEKSKLYEFFHDPTPYFQALQHELMKKEVLLSAYYKDNYETLLDVHSKTTFDSICENLIEIRDLNFLRDEEQGFFTSFCLLNKFFINFCPVADGIVYLLGFDYVSIISALVKAKKKHSLADLCGVLSETSRIEILKLLLERKEVTCKDLKRIFNFSGSTAYHHLSLLTKIGAINVRNEKKIIYYSLNKKYFDNMISQLKVFANN